MPDLEMELSSLMAAAAELEAELGRLADAETPGDVGPPPPDVGARLRNSVLRPLQQAVPTAAADRDDLATGGRVAGAIFRPGVTGADDAL